MPTRPLLLTIATLALAAITCASTTTAATAQTTCTPSLAQPPQAPAYANVPWPSEHADTWRTHAAAAGLPANLRSRTLKTATATLPPVPVWGYTGTRRDVYVVGGAPYLLDMFTELLQGAPANSIPALVLASKRYSTTTTPYLAKIDTRTMKVRVLPLTGGKSVNYTGGALVHANGYVYAVARSVLYKIDPKTIRIVKSTRLPLAPGSHGANKMTAYNGMQATRDGDLILKGWASTGGGDAPPGILLRIDPDTLRKKVRLVTTDVASPRMTIVEDGGQEYLYFPTTSRSVRWKLEPKAFTLDPSWSAGYTLDGATTASSDVYMGEGVVFSDNTDPTAENGMRVFAQPDTGPALVNTPAFTDTSTPGWNFFMMAGDPYRSGIAVVEDQANGFISAFTVCAGGGQVEKKWETDSLAPTAGVSINYRAGHLYTDDRRCTAKGRCRLFLVVLDLRSGRELARVRVKGEKPSIGQIFVGRGAVYYTATDTRNPNGYVTRVTAE